VSHLGQRAFPPDDPRTELEAIARMVARLSPSWRDPEQFHMAKSEISARLRALAGISTGQPWPPHQPPRSLAQLVMALPPKPSPVRVVCLRPHLYPVRLHRYPKPPVDVPAQGRLFG
jgi:hypothetical protein